MSPWLRNKALENEQILAISLRLGHSGEQSPAEASIVGVGTHRARVL